MITRSPIVVLALSLSFTFLSILIPFRSIFSSVVPSHSTIMPNNKRSRDEVDNPTPNGSEAQMLLEKITGLKRFRGGKRGLLVPDTGNSLPGPSAEVGIQPEGGDAEQAEIHSEAGGSTSNETSSANLDDTRCGGDFERQESDLETKSSILPGEPVPQVGVPSFDVSSILSKGPSSQAVLVQAQAHERIISRMGRVHDELFHPLTSTGRREICRESLNHLEAAHRELLAHVDLEGAISLVHKQLDFLMLVRGGRSE